MYVNYVGSLVNQTTPFPITELKGVVWFTCDKTSSSLGVV